MALWGPSAAKGHCAERGCNWRARSIRSILRRLFGDVQGDFAGRARIASPMMRPGNPLGRGAALCQGRQPAAGAQVDRCRLRTVWTSGSRTV
jgi:hypothetical protein